MKKSIGSQNSAQLSHILGVDFGLTKIGLAIADSETKMAFGLEVLKNDDQIFTKLKDLIKDRQVQGVVLGMTKHAKDPKSSKKKEEFANKLKALGVQIFFQEEMFTTKMAHSNLKLHGKKNIAAADDKEAARIILQSWLDGE